MRRNTNAELSLHDPFCLNPPFSVSALLEDAAHRHGSATAFVGVEERMTFSELFYLSRRVASYVAATVEPHELIAVILPATPQGIACLLGCWLAGRVACVLNPADPAARSADILAGARPAAVMLDSEDLLARLTLPHHIKVLRPADAFVCTGDTLLPVIDPDAPALVYFTSGSSGRPKGIAVSARSIFHRATCEFSTTDFAIDACLLAMSPHWVSSSLPMTLMALFCGARLIVISLASAGAATVMRLMRREKLTMLVCPPPIVAMLLRLDYEHDISDSAFASLRLLRSGAASLPTDELRRWRAQLPGTCTIVHTYASTEAMIMATWRIPDGIIPDEPYVPLGHILPRVEACILDAEDREVGRGEIGELVVQGRDLAIGEWQEGRLIDGRMQPVSSRPGWRVFRTGDLVRMGADGLLRFISRVDRQIKVNGVRIEPGEIESVLRRVPHVADVVVSGYAIDAHTVIEAFVATPGVNSQLVRALLDSMVRESLPPAMRPSRWLILDALLRLPSGKVDVIGMRRLLDAQDA